MVKNCYHSLLENNHRRVTDNGTGHLGGYCLEDPEDFPGKGRTHVCVGAGVREENFWGLLEGKGCCTKGNPDACIGASGGALASFMRNQ